MSRIIAITRKEYVRRQRGRPVRRKCLRYLDDGWFVCECKNERPTVIPSFTAWKIRAQIFQIFIRHRWSQAHSVFCAHAWISCFSLYFIPKQIYDITLSCTIMYNHVYQSNGEITDSIEHNRLGAFFLLFRNFLFH